MLFSYIHFTTDLAVSAGANLVKSRFHAACIVSNVWLATHSTCTCYFFQHNNFPYSCSSKTSPHKRKSVFHCLHCVCSVYRVIIPKSLVKMWGYDPSHLSQTLLSNDLISLVSSPAFFKVMIVLTISLDRFGLPPILLIGGKFPMGHLKNCPLNICWTHTRRLICLPSSVVYPVIKHIPVFFRFLVWYSIPQVPPPPTPRPRTQGERGRWVVRQ